MDIKCKGKIPVDKRSIATYLSRQRRKTWFKIPKPTTISASEIDVCCGHSKTGNKLERRKRTTQGEKIVSIGKILSESEPSTSVKSLHQFKDILYKQLNRCNEFESFYDTNKQVN